MSVATLVLLALVQLAYGQLSLDISARVPQRDALDALRAKTGRNFVQRQQDRVRTQLDLTSGGVSLGVRLHGRNGFDAQATDVLNAYTADISFGKGGKAGTYALLIDTGSAFTWAGSRAPYNRSSTTKDQKRDYYTAYGSGSTSGEFVKDTLRFAGIPASEITSQGVGDSQSSTGFGNVDGILGLGLRPLTSGVVDGLDTIQTVTETMTAQKVIPENVVGCAFTPNPAGNEAVRGKLTLGGTDTTQYRGKLTYASRDTSTDFWGARSSLTYAGKSLGPKARGMVDSGTTLFLVPDDAFTAYQKAIPGSRIHPDTGFLLIPRTSFASMSNFTFTWANRAFTLIPDAQVLPPALGARFIFPKDNPNGDLLSILNTSGGDDFSIGMQALTRFYAVFDTTRQRIGLAETSHTFDRTAGLAPSPSPSPKPSPSPSKATPKPSSTTKKPTSTKKPSSSTKKPTSTKKPSSSTKKPTSTKKPSSSTKKPTSTKKPSSSTKKPTSTHKPTSTKKPTSTHKPTSSKKSSTHKAARAIEIPTPHMRVPQRHRRDLARRQDHF